MDTFDRLKLIDTYAKNKSDAYLLLEALKIISVATLNSLPTSGSKVGKWDSISKNVLRAQKYLSQNASTKLVLTDLVLSL